MFSNPPVSLQTKSLKYLQGLDQAGFDSRSIFDGALVEE
jgi:hypothetical protein